MNNLVVKAGTFYPNDGVVSNKTEKNAFKNILGERYSNVINSKGKFINKSSLVETIMNFTDNIEAADKSKKADALSDSDKLKRVDGFLKLQEDFISFLVDTYKNQPGYSQMPISKIRTECKNLISEQLFPNIGDFTEGDSTGLF